MAETVDIPKELVADFCKRWKIVEFALFGSVLSESFSHDSDIDVLVTFSPDACWSLLDHVQMQDELKILLRRDVDLVTRKGIERSRNHIRREEILKSAKVIYAAA